MSEAYILEMEQVTAGARVDRITGLEALTFALAPGAMMLIEPEPHVETVSLFDVASGLIMPDEGSVRFGRQEWRAMSLFRQSAARGSIGRVFEEGGWVSNLSMFENIALSQRHHTRRPDSELRKEALGLLTRVGLRDCLGDRPHMLSRGHLRRAQWARAFMGERRLLLLNEPLVDVPSEHHRALFDLIREGRARGAAVIWQASRAGALEGCEGCEGAISARFSAGRLVMPASGTGAVGGAGDNNTGSEV